MNEEDLLSKLASRAKRKLNKTTEEELKPIKKNLGTYEFVKSSQCESHKKLEKKIAQLLMSNPDCIDPIGRLIDHSVYDILPEAQKQAYILKLSASYREISEKLNV